MIKEDIEFRAYLEAHGWDTTQMGTGEETSFAEDEKASYDVKTVV